MKIDRDSIRGKRPYTKPQLKTIDLVAEEVLGAGCKMPATSGPSKPSCAMVGKCLLPTVS